MLFRSAFLFDHKCVFTFKKKDGIDMDDLILELIDFNVEDEYDEDEEEGTITIYGDPKSFGAIHKFLEEKGFEDVGGEFMLTVNFLSTSGETEEKDFMFYITPRLAPGKPIISNPPRAYK